MSGGWVYIMTNRPNGTSYVGVTANLARRVWEHREGVADSFTKQYGLKRLVHAERHEDIRAAIQREGAVACPAVHYAIPEDRRQYDILQSIRTLTLLEHDHPEKRRGGRYHFRMWCSRFSTPCRCRGVYLSIETWPAW